MLGNSKIPPEWPSVRRGSRQRAGRLALDFVLLVVCAGGLAAAPLVSLAQGTASHLTSDVPPDAAAQILKVSPDRAQAGSAVTVEIDGKNFSAGAYVSFSDPAVRVVSTDVLDATHLNAALEINPAAKPGTITLYVSNPAGPAAQTPFTILEMAVPQMPPAPAPTPETATTALAPTVTAVEPPRIAPGSQTTLKIHGKGFAEGTKVSFSNPGIQILGTHFSKSSLLTVDVQVAKDAAPGQTGLFVVNPDDTEVEFPFEVTDGSSATTSMPGAAKTAASTSEQKFEVYSLGDTVSILQNPSQSQGTLIVSGGKLRYEEGGKVVFSATAAEVQEIAMNIVFGINTGTFHVILKSSKTYNFVGTSFRPADTQAIVDSLRRALQ
jgi:Quinohemoprotein amine dehydrogenase, alpha subunit domain III